MTTSSKLGDFLLGRLSQIETPMDRSPARPKLRPLPTREEIIEAAMKSNPERTREQILETLSVVGFDWPPSNLKKEGPTR